VARAFSVLKAQGLRWRNAILKALSASGLSGVRRCIPRPWRHGLRSTLEKSIHRDFEFVRSMEWQQLSATTGITPSGIHANHEGTPLPPLPALDLHGYFSRWLGLGECARLFARALIASGYTVILHDVDVDIPHARRDRTLTEYFDNASGSGNDLVFINPDYWEAALRRMGEDRSGRRIMGYWFWELEHFPESWLPALDQVDEILVSSVFVERAMQQVSTKPVTRIPIPVVPCAGSWMMTITCSCARLTSVRRLRARIRMR
jgi:hypothetical protein